MKYCRLVCWVPWAAERWGGGQILCLLGFFGSKKEKTGGHIRKRVYGKIQEYLIESERILKSEAWEGVGHKSVRVSPGPRRAEGLAEAQQMGTQPCGWWQGWVCHFLDL